MSHLMIFWYVVVGIVLLIFLINFISYLLSHKRGHHHPHIVDVSRDVDIFYIPGDNLHKDNTDEFD